MLDDLLSREDFFEELLDCDFSLLYLPRLVVGHPRSLKEHIFQSKTILSLYLQLQIQEFLESQEHLLLDRLDPYLDDINSVLEHVVVSFISPKDLDGRKQVQTSHSLQEVNALTVLYVA